MIVTFKSKVAADIIMFGDAAHKLMKIMGKDPDPTGIITAEQLPEAIAALKAAIAEDRARGQSDEEAEDDKPAMTRTVTLQQRATPLLDMLERSLSKKVPVVWGV